MTANTTEMKAMSSKIYQMTHSNMDILLKQSTVSTSEEEKQKETDTENPAENLYENKVNIYEKNKLNDNYSHTIVTVSEGQVGGSLDWWLVWGLFGFINFNGQS